MADNLNLVAVAALKVSACGACDALWVWLLRPLRKTRTRRTSRNPYGTGIERRYSPPNLSGRVFPVLPPTHPISRFYPTSPPSNAFACPKAGVPRIFGPHSRSILPARPVPELLRLARERGSCRLGSARLPLGHRPNSLLPSWVENTSAPVAEEVSHTGTSRQKGP